MQTYSSIDKMNEHAAEAEKAGQEFYKTNQNFTACVREAAKLYNSVWLQDCFVAGRNRVYWASLDKGVS